MTIKDLYAPGTHDHKSSAFAHANAFVALVELALGEHDLPQGQCLFRELTLRDAAVTDGNGPIVLVHLARDHARSGERYMECEDVEVYYGGLTAVASMASVASAVAGRLMCSPKKKT